jgi:hypothetical protein
MKISCDHETRSPVDLKKAGAHVYFEHPETRVLMTAYRLDDGPLKIWRYDQPAPVDLQNAIASGAEINGWNAQFEALGFNLLADRAGWPAHASSSSAAPPPPPPRWPCPERLATSAPRWGSTSRRTKRACG